MAGNAGLFKFLRPSLRPQSTDITAAAMWGVALTSGAVWLVQLDIPSDIKLALTDVLVLHHRVSVALHQLAIVWMIS
ncbi:Ubiquinol-cytochrome c reductase complex 6-protein [Nymphaea thermarum]|nr:Ubiquinol-cytochrome c reductase complex 6-protein [Nymphaea thermarum]